MVCPGGRYSGLIAPPKLGHGAPGIGRLGVQRGMDMTRRLLAVAAACLALAACTTTNTKVALGADQAPPPGARVLLMQPDVQLGLLTASGVTEPRADWSQSGQANLAREIQSQLNTRSHTLKVSDPDSLMEGRQGQLLRLHQAVGESVLMFNYGPFKLPTKPGFDWTLGSGAQAIAAAQQVDYALFVRGQGSYASGARVAAAVGMSMLGVAVPLGEQRVFASLVDLRTGQVVWFNVAVAGPQADMREGEGAASLTASLLEDIPL